MATATDQQPRETTAELEAEVERLRGELTESRRRGGTVALAAFFAALLGLAALVGVAFRVNHDQDTLNAMHRDSRSPNPVAGIMPTPRPHLAAAHPVGATGPAERCS